MRFKSQFIDINLHQEFLTLYVQFPTISTMVDQNCDVYLHIIRIIHGVTDTESQTAGNSPYV